MLGGTDSHRDSCLHKDEETGFGSRIAEMASFELCIWSTTMHVKRQPCLLRQLPSQTLTGRTMVRAFLFMHLVTSHMPTCCSPVTGGCTQSCGDSDEQFIIQIESHERKCKGVAPSIACVSEVCGSKEDAACMYKKLVRSTRACRMPHSRCWVPQVGHHSLASSEAMRQSEAMGTACHLLACRTLSLAAIPVP